jgi:ferredoxin-NADP reductase
MSEQTLQWTTDAPHGGWRPALVREVRRETPRTVVLRLDVTGRVPHMPGQRYVVRLTAEDGYTASRSYSVASAPSDPLVELCVERVDDGEVSTHLVDVVEPGDELDVRGPLGGWFAWAGVTAALAIGGGTGVVPLISMLRHARDIGHPERVCLIGAGRTLDELPYADELMTGCTGVALSREAAPDGRPAGRIRAEDLVQHIAGRDVFFVCGSARFAETASRLLVDLGVTAGRIRIERFGPSD